MVHQQSSKGKPRKVTSSYNFCTGNSSKQTIELTIEPRIISLCKKTSQKLNAFTKIKFDQRKFLLNVFITSQFSYVAVIWTFHNRKLSNYIHPIYERVLGIVYQDHNSTFDELHAKEISFTLRDRNLQKFLMKYSPLK